MRPTFSLLLLLLLLTSCRRPDDTCTECIPPSDSTYTGPLEVLWQIPLNPDTIECASMQPVFHNGNVLYSLLFYVDGYELLRMVDGKTGDLVWSWDPL